ncbi:alpha/beta-hydrolase family protein [Devosia sp. XJ19-1]|uniref:Alpha/beta-hydrolase family protein n=1 Tax=Devosia ureilytica TaxID=2952754 RepID=A0A9Q4FU56_9HYPH|nr:alpha/beta-hydrolase family protein [Devosia ureilytica]MCP8884926.1 alpha/beta-hydrolase family protein [Devosia ureilytica]MCP8888563.1 alpha/beta-hydrolase family protein [Devosia ureilytica]
MTTMQQRPSPSWSRRANALWDDVAYHLSPPGLVVGAVFFALSLTPSLLPRTEIVQGVLSGCCFALGYAFGNLGHWLWGFLGLKVPPGRVTRALGAIAGLVCLGLVLLALYYSNTWQNSVRAVMGMAPVDEYQPLLIASMALPVAAGLLILGKLLVTLIRLVWHWLMPHLPRRAAFVLATALVIALVSVLVNNLFLRAALRAADGFYERLDALVSTEAEPPAHWYQTGSAVSLIDWESIGRDSRLYVQSGPDAAAITAITGKPAMEPLRTYVGLRSAPSIEERAALALAELKRIGAFERSALVLVMPVGTGWVDRAAMDTLEYLHGGDVASVAVQYSYLTSVLSLWIEPELGTETAQALFNAVYGYWTQLPVEERPRLYLHGLSLGALASQNSTTVYDVLADPFNGALWAGPPFSSPIWSRVTQNRQAGTPQWLPRFGNSSAIRFMNQSGASGWEGLPWGPMRIVFLQYASDPVVFFSFDADWRRPDWFDEPRGPDVSPALNWYPVVTFLQLALDAALAQTPPVGYGHVYAPADYIDAWYAVTQPAGWTPASLEALKLAIDPDDYAVIRK